MSFLFNDRPGFPSVGGKTPKFPRKVYIPENINPLTPNTSNDDIFKQKPNSKKFELGE